jgi:peroxiredoxin
MSRILGVGQKVVRATASHGLLVLLCGSVIINAALARELRDARRRSDRQISAGTEVPPIDGRSVNGDAVTLTYRGERPTVLYYFSPTCNWCERNWRNVQALVAATRGRFRVVGLSASEKAGEHLSARGVTIDLVSGFSQAIASEYRLGGTPQTIVVAPNGRVLRAWTGAYTGRVSGEIEAYFGIRLPGLTELSTVGGEVTSPR